MPDDFSRGSRYASLLLILSSLFFFLNQYWLFMALILLGFFILLSRFFLRQEHLLNSKANIITLIRLFATLALPILAQKLSFSILGAIVLFLFFLDWLDGKVARSLNQATPLGAFFDEEVDALFIMVVSFLLFQKSNDFALFLLIAYLRPIFVIAFAKIKQRVTIKFVLAKYLYFCAMMSLIISFFWADLIILAGILATTLLCISFSVELAKMLRALNQKAIS